MPKRRAKKKTSGSQTALESQEPQRRAPINPPRRNLALLLASVVLFLCWTGVLIWLAVETP